MNTRPYAFIAALLVTGTPLPAQQATGPTPQPEQRMAEQQTKLRSLMHRPGPAR